MKIIKLIINIDDYVLIKQSNKKAYYIPYFETESDNLEEEIKNRFIGATLKEIRVSSFNIEGVIVYEIYLTNYKLNSDDKLLYVDELLSLEYSDLDYEIIRNLL